MRVGKGRPRISKRHLIEERQRGRMRAKRPCQRDRPPDSGRLPSERRGENELSCSFSRWTPGCLPGPFLRRCALPRRPEATRQANQIVPAALLAIRRGLVELQRIAMGAPREGEKARPTCRDVLVAHAALTKLVEMFAPSLASTFEAWEYRQRTKEEILGRGGGANPSTG